MILPGEKSNEEIKKEIQKASAEYERQRLREAAEKKRSNEKEDVAQSFSTDDRVCETCGRRLGAEEKLRALPTDRPTCLNCSNSYYNRGTKHSHPTKLHPY